MEHATTLSYKRKLQANKKTRNGKIVSFIILFIVSVIFAFPFVYMIGTSFKSEADMLTNPLGIFPAAGEWTLKNYSGFIIRDGHLDNMPKWMFNSLVLAGCSIIFTILFCSMTAFAFSFLKFKWRDRIYKILIMSMTIPSVICTTIQYTMYATVGSATGLFDNIVYIYFWFIFPSVASVYNVYLMRNACKAIPMDIVESARADGASNVRIYFSIVMPIIRSTLLLIVLFTFVGSWNSLLWPQLLLSGKDSGYMTVTVALTGFIAQADGAISKAVSMATAVFSMIPIMIVFLFTQNKMIDGMATSGVKG